MKPFSWVNATTVAEALAAVGQDGAFKAGGVDVMDLLKEELVAPARLVNLRTIGGLDRLSDGEAGLVLGPLVTLATLAADGIVASRYRALADAAAHAATPQIRNAATAAGNLLQRPRCWYFRQAEFHCRKKGGPTCFAQEGENQYHAIFDNHVCAAVHPSALATALVALGGSIAIASASGTRLAPLEGFFTRSESGPMRENTLAPGELVTEIRVPKPRPGATSAYRKLMEKQSFDWPLVEVAVVLERSGTTCTKASIVLGGVAHVPYRARGAETTLEGKNVDEALARAAGRAAAEGATPLALNRYKVALVETAVARTVLAAMQG